MSQSTERDMVLVPSELIDRILQHCWLACSSLENQCLRQRDLPESYRHILYDAFEALHDLEQFMPPLSPPPAP